VTSGNLSAAQPEGHADGNVDAESILNLLILLGLGEGFSMTPRGIIVG
jgi:hypothetical protein